MAHINSSSGSIWLMYTLMTVLLWGVYGILLHAGQGGMADPAHGRYKAFLFVGLAYFLAAVLAPAAMLLFRGASWAFPKAGMLWSLLAGLAGAFGAFGVLLAFGSKGSPATVMTIVFAGAPVVNALIALMIHPPQGGLKSIPPPFYIGIMMAVLGAALVTIYKPKPAVRHASEPPAEKMEGLTDE